MGGVVNVSVRRRVLLAVLASVLIVPPGTTSALSPRPGWVKVVVDVSDQTLEAYDEAGVLQVRWPVSTGAASTPTPTGTFKVHSKSRTTFALSNPRVTMSHMVRFRGGVGFHSVPRLDGVPLATPLGVRGVSHGCVRLADAHAARLYANVALGATVVVRP